MRATPDEQRVIDFFDEAARGYGDAYMGNTLTAQFFNRRKQIVLGALEGLEGGRLLDVGCGPGMMARPCHERGFAYVGIDISAGMVAEARRRFGEQSGINFIVGRMQSLPFQRDSFDVILCMGALEYLATDDAARSVGEMTRVLDEEGLLIASFLNASSFYWIFDQWREYLSSTRTGLRNRWRHGTAVSATPRPRVAVRKFHHRQCRELLEHSGFRVGDTTFFCTALLPPPLDRRLPRLATWMSRRSEGLAGGPLWRWAMGFILVAQKLAPDA